MLWPLLSAWKQGQPRGRRNLSFDFLESDALAPLVAAIVGSVLIALAGLERLLSARSEDQSKGRRRIMYVIVALTMTINIALYWFQYHNVTTVRKRTEHE